MVILLNKISKLNLIEKLNEIVFFFQMLMDRYIFLYIYMLNKKLTALMHLSHLSQHYLNILNISSRVSS